MMDLIALVEDVTHNLRWWRIDNGRRDDIGHVPMISILRYLRFRI